MNNWIKINKYNIVTCNNLILIQQINKLYERNTIEASSKSLHNLTTGNKKDTGNKQLLYHITLKLVLKLFITNSWMVNAE